MRVSAFFSVVLLATMVLGSATVSADHRDGFRNGRWDRGFNNRWDGPRWNHRRGNRQWRSGFRAGRAFGQPGIVYWNSHPRVWRSGWGNRRWNNRGWNHWGWGPGGLAVGTGLGLGVGTALGAGLGHSLSHNHHCPDFHEPARGSRSEISGCYRIEVLPDGRERRVDLPLSQCR